MMRNKVLLMAWFCFVTGSVLLAQNQYAVSNIAPELLKNSHTVVRYEKMELDIPSVSKSVLKYKYVATLLNEKSSANELVVFYDSFNKVGKIKGKIYDASGKLVRELKKSEFKDQSRISGFSMYEDNRIIYLEVNHSDYPYTVEFEYKKTNKKYMYYPLWYIQNFRVAVEDATLVVNVFNESQLAYKAQNIELDPIIEKNETKRKYTWSVSDKVAIKGEPNAPSSLKILPTILLTPKSFKLEGYSGNMDSWSSYGSFMNKLNQGRDELPAEMKNKVKELIENLGTDRQKIDVLYKYLQENTRYVSVQLGVGGWQTFDAKYVSKNQYGDCKALTNYMKSMLKEVGIKAYPVLIRSGEPDDWLEEEFVFPAFNHVILNIPSEDYWLECTSSTHPPNYLGSDNENRKAFRYTETGGELIKTPDYKAEQNQEKNKAEITLKATGDAHIKNETLFTGTKQEYYRSVNYLLSQEEQEKKFIKSENLPSFTINQYEIQVNDTKPEATQQYDIDIKRYASKGGKRLFVPLNLINPSSYIPASTEKRIHPLHLTQDYFDEDQIIINLPESYEVESAPQLKFELKTDFGSYQTELEVKGNQLIYKRKLMLIPGDFPAERYNDYRIFRKEIATRDAAKIVLVKRKA